MTQPQDPRLAQILEHYGRDHQRWKLVEECGELLAELGRFRNGDRTNVADLIHECADVLIVARQLYRSAPTYTETTGDAQADVDSLTVAVVLLTNFTVNDTPSTVKLWADAMENRAAGFAALLGAEKMLADAIEMKTARQIERIEAEERE